MRLAVTALLFVFSVFAQDKVPPDPRKSNQPGPGGDNVINNRQNDKTPPAQSTAVKNSDAPQDSTDKRPDVAPQDKEQAVRISAIPRVSVEPIKDWADHSIWIFNGLLVIVGVLQYTILVRQTRIINDSLAEAKKSADAAKVSADVAKQALEISHRANVGILALDFIPAQLGGHIRERGDQLINGRIRLVMKNTGLTEAKHCYFTIMLKIAEPLVADVDPIPFVSHHLDLHPGMPAGEESAPLKDLLRNTLILQRAIETGKFSISGFVRYSDIFGRGVYLAFKSDLEPPGFKFGLVTQTRDDGEQPDPRSDSHIKD